MIQQQFAVQAAYQAAMNRQFYAACEGLNAEQLTQDNGVFFKSVMGTLNHMLLTDRIWLATFQKEKYAYESLSQILYADFAELREARETTDTDIAVWLSGVTDEQLQAGFHDRL
ncbi:MAG: DinB family protein, partial [Gammaproteobacteria bacterium]|nr:DinB family protein [Gammaproteobacteria bacterium]